MNHNKKRVERGEIASGTLKNYIKVIKFFYDMNNISSINWNIVNDDDDHQSNPLYAQKISQIT